MEDPDRRGSLGQASAKSIRDYAPERIFNQWEVLFQKVVEKTADGSSFCS